MSRIAFLCVAALAAPAGALAGSARPKVAVMSIEASGIPAQDVSTLAEVLSTELSAIGRYEVISSRDIESMLAHEGNRQALGCDTAGCFAEIGGALGADYLIAPQLSRLGELYVVNIKLIDVKRGKALRRVSERVDGDLDDVLEAIRFSIAALTDPNAGEGVVRGRPFISTGPLLAAGAAVAGLGVGIGFGLKARSHYDHATDPSYSGGQYEVEKGESAQLIANVGFGAAALAGMTATLLFVLWDTDLFAGTATVTPSVSASGSGATLTVAF
jgi:TolB-like protein